MLVLIFAILTLPSQYNSDNVRLIVGGKNVSDIGNYPHALYILFACPNHTGTWLCGGSVLTQNILITAAHCINIYCEMRIEAVAGSEVIDKEKSIIRNIHQYYTHKYFDDEGPSLRNDIALLGIKVPLPLGRNIKRVVVGHHFPTKSKMVAVAGWGRTSNNSTELSKGLKFVLQFLESKTYCQKSLGESLWPGQMCASNSRKNYPTIYDSGGALVTITGQQLGILSWNIPQKPELVVYTNVSYFYPWIRKHTRLLYCAVSKLHVDIDKDDYYGEDPNVVDLR